MEVCNEKRNEPLQFSENKKYAAYFMKYKVININSTQTKNISGINLTAINVHGCGADGLWTAVGFFKKATQTS